MGRAFLDAVLMGERLWLKPGRFPAAQTALTAGVRAAREAASQPDAHPVRRSVGCPDHASVQLVGVDEQRLHQTQLLSLASSHDQAPEVEGLRALTATPRGIRITNQPLSELLRVWQQLLERVHGAVLLDELRAGPGDLHRLDCQDIHLQAGTVPCRCRAMDGPGGPRHGCQWHAGKALAHAVPRLGHICPSIAVLLEADEVQDFTTHAAEGYVE
mmetsp:Transcript_55815/g.150363  ORF Transcript_55815/g.150363 Transcript_55815/m.150363 type:complete len:215 (+) Transcript_55815:168-812(+)